MPTYQYACTDCDHRFEQVQSFSDDALTTCPRCEGRLRKLFNAVGVVFKGSGFYRNDSRETAGKNGSGTAAGSGEKTDKPAETSGEKKDATSAEKPAAKSGEKSGAKPSEKSATAASGGGSSSSSAASKTG